MWLLIVLVAAVVVYASTVSHGFVFDDGVAIIRNFSIRSLASIPDIFSQTEWSAGGRENHLYRPLTTTTYALNYAISGLSPWSYHLTNVLLHGLISVLVLLLGLRWRLPTAAAGIAALMFAVHPIHVEAVANVVGRKELLVGFFLISMALLHSRAVRVGGLYFALSALAYTAAMFSKEIGIVGIGIVAIQDLLIRNDRSESLRSRYWIQYAAYGLLALLFLVVWVSVAGPLSTADIPRLDNPTVDAPVVVRWMTGIAVIGKGFTLQFLPINQSPDYSFDAIPLVTSALNWRFLFGSAAIAAWLAVGVRLRAAAPAVLIGAWWYLLTILPASNLLFPVGTIFGERLLYVPSAGLLIAAAGLVAHSLRGRGISTIIVTAFVGVTATLLSIGTIRYSEAWADELSLFTVAVEHAPSSTKAHHKLGEALRDAGLFEEAVAETNTALDIAPDNIWARLFLAEMLHENGFTTEAAAEVEYGLSLGPNAEALYAAGLLERDAGRLDEAAEFWSQALVINPGHAASLADLGTLALVRGDTASAISFYDRAAESDPGLGHVWYNMAMIFESRGDRQAAQIAYTRFVETAGPEYAEVVEQVRRRLQQQ